MPPPIRTRTAAPWTGNARATPRHSGRLKGQNAGGREGSYSERPCQIRPMTKK